MVYLYAETAPLPPRWVHDTAPLQTDIIFEHVNLLTARIFADASVPG